MHALLDPMIDRFHCLGLHRFCWGGKKTMLDSSLTCFLSHEYICSGQQVLRIPIVALRVPDIAHTGTAETTSKQIG